MNKMSAIVPMLALVALAACGDKDGDDTNGGADTTTVVAPTVTPMDTTSGMTPPATMPAGTDSMGAMGSDSMGAMGGAGANQSDTLIKVDSTKKM